MNEISKWKRVVSRVLSYVLVAAVTAVATFGLTNNRNVATQSEWSKIDRLTSIIDQYYIEDYDMDALIDGAAAGIVDALGNPWSYYVPASQYQAYMDDHTNTYVGIGVTVNVTEDGAGLLVQKVEVGSGAQDAGLAVGDIIVAVGDQTITELGLEGATNLIRGEEGTAATITILRDEKEMTLEVTRKRIEVVVATGQMLPGNVGLITIVNFNERSSDETIGWIETLLAQGAESFIFDVRFNPGGYKDEMVKILDYILPEGELFRSVDYRGVEEVDRSDSKCLEMPMVVLINQDSYSAAEFFAAAMQEYEWATVIGTPSTGKSHYQITIPLGDGSAVNLSVGKYYTPNGVSLADVGGLQPNKIVEVDDETYAAIYYGQLEPENDPQIQAALEVLKSGK